MQGLDAYASALPPLPGALGGGHGHARNLAAMTSFPTLAVIVLAIGATPTNGNGVNLNMSFAVVDGTGANGLYTSIPLPTAAVGGQLICTLNAGGAVSY